MKKPETVTLQISTGVKATEEERSSYDVAETQFETLLETEALDKNLTTLHPIIQDFERTLEHALITAYQDSPGSETAHRFLQRVLYRINRLKLFWYDDLKRYKNERSLYIRTIRDQIEEAWQAWEIKWFDISALKEIKVEESLREEARNDLESK
ncbi:MAG: iron-containing redox enzyme family protein, partial [bacterium]